MARHRNCREVPHRPTHHNGRIYVATLDRSSIDGAFYETRGFHWYALDPVDNSFVDLSAAEPDGIGAKHLQVVTIAPDAEQDLRHHYPREQVLYLDVEKQETTVVGKPKEWEATSQQSIHVDRFKRTPHLQVVERSQWNCGEDPRVLDTVWKYDPQADSKRLISAWKHFRIEVGQWDSERQTSMSVTTWGISTGSLM